MIKGIVAIAKNGLIGYDNRIVWNHPEDMQHFKQKTEGNLVVMGSKTFESLGCKPLANRTNIVLSHNKSFQGTVKARHVGEVFEFYHAQSNDLYVIGGAEIYHLFEPFIEAWWVTRIKQDFELLASVHKDTVRRFTPDLRQFVRSESFTIKSLNFEYHERK